MWLLHEISCCQVVKYSYLSLTTRNIIQCTSPVNSYVALTENSLFAHDTTQ